MVIKCDWIKHNSTGISSLNWIKTTPCRLCQYHVVQDCMINIWPPWYQTMKMLFKFNFLSNTKTTYSQMKNICRHFVMLKLFHMHSLNLFTTTMIMTLVIHWCLKKHLKGHEIVKSSTAKCNIQSLSVKSICSLLVSMSIKYIFLNNNSNTTHKVTCVYA